MHLLLIFGMSRDTLKLIVIDAEQAKFSIPVSGGCYHQQATLSLDDTPPADMFPVEPYSLFFTLNISSSSSLIHLVTSCILWRLHVMRKAPVRLSDSRIQVRHYNSAKIRQLLADHQTQLSMIRDFLTSSTLPPVHQSSRYGAFLEKTDAITCDAVNFADLIADLRELLRRILNDVIYACI